jgi:signal transduction histidine kinase
VRNKLQFAFASSWPLTLALAAAILLVVSINVLWWRLDSQAAAQADLVDHTHQVIAALEETLARADDMVIGQRGFALTHEQDFLKPYFTATNRMPILLRALRDLVHDNPKALSALDRLEPVIANYERVNQEHISALTKSNPLDPDLGFRRTIRDSMDQIRTIIGQLVNDENKLLEQRQITSRRAAKIVTRVNVVACVVSVGLIIAIFTALWREYARRRASEMELQRSHEKLEDRVRERTASLLQSESERMRLEKEILEASDREMQRIGHDLHDGVGQQLTALSLYTTGLQKEAEAQAPTLVDAFKKIALELRAVIRQVRVLSHGLSPVSLQDNGLVEAMRKLADDTRSAAKVNCEFEDKAETKVADAYVAAQLYRVGQEAVTNALKHSQASSIRISLRSTLGLTELKIADNGCGFSVAKLNGNQGLGLRAMKHRADVIGAAMNINSAPGKGTQITCSLKKANLE